LKIKEDTQMAAIDDVLENNRRYAVQFHEPGVPRPPTRQLVVVSCMDTRVGVSQLLDLGLGEAHIIRNAGGVVTEDVMRSLIISHYIGGTQEIMIINNTKCGMLTFSDDELLARIETETHAAAVVPACFHAFTNLEENVRQQVRKVRSHPWIPESVSVRGFIYDVDTGRLREVAVSSPEA
jgi:carbonic anhydrase